MAAENICRVRVGVTYRAAGSNSRPHFEPLQYPPPGEKPQQQHHGEDKEYERQACR